jgi:hypothetical protein
MRAFLKIVLHAAIGGFSTGTATALQTGAPITSKTVLIPGLVGAITGVLALFAKRPQD